MAKNYTPRLAVELDRPAWLENLSFGLPRDFDFTCTRNQHEAMSLIWALPNSDRGEAAVGLFKALGAPLDKRVVYSGLVAAHAV
jgi:hypothetical protein